MLIMTTIDDISLESIPYIGNRLIDNGANNFHIINSFTKKGRMEYILFVDLDENKLEDVSSLLALEFGTIGMRILSCEHLKFPFKLKTKDVSVEINKQKFNKKIKIKYLYNLNDEIISLKAEYEDLKIFSNEIASNGFNISFSKIKTIIEAEAYNDDLDEIKLSL